MAASYYFHITGMKERMKNAGKDALKSLASLGTMRFTTVEMPTPLLLADDGLHIFELDARAVVNKHFLLEHLDWRTQLSVILCTINRLKFLETVQDTT